MSISFNHPKNTVTSTGTLNLTVTGGNTSTPQPIRFNSTSVIMPVRALPAGEAGAMVFDTGTKTMKYHDGLSWVELLGQDTILAPIYNELTLINQSLGTKVDSVLYNVGSVPQASISGTQLNITFPFTSSGGGGANGLFTSSKQGAIQHYALTSGMNAATIREQMSGISGGQNGRAGTQSSPWKTNDGWCFSDGMWWTWAGENGTVTQQVPNLNQNAYLKPMAVNGVTQINTVIVSSATITPIALSIAQLPAHSFTISGSTDWNGDHSHNVPLDSGDKGWGRPEQANNALEGYCPTTVAGNHFHTFTGTTNTLGSGQTHTHGIQNIDVNHLTTAVLYNIATPSFALNEAAANGKYVLKAGDVMTGTLTIATGAVIRGDDTNITFALRNNANAERAMIYHSNTTNTLRMRSAGGTEVFINTAGLLQAQALTSASSVNTSTLAVSANNATVGGRNVVRAVNGVTADGNGNVTITAGIQGVQLGYPVNLYQGGWYGNYGGANPGYVLTAYESFSKSRHLAGQMRPIQVLIGGQWLTISQTG